MITCLAILVSFLVGSLAGLSLRPPRPESVALVQLRRRHAALVERVLAATGGDREEDIAAGLDELAAVRAAGIRAQEHVHQLAGQLDRVYRERNAAATAALWRTSSFPRTTLPPPSGSSRSTTSSNSASTPCPARNAEEGIETAGGGR